LLFERAGRISARSYQGLLLRWDGFLSSHERELPTAQNQHDPAISGRCDPSLPRMGRAGKAGDGVVLSWPSAAAIHREDLSS